MNAEVRVAEGRLLGLEEESCFVFKGVPFAQAARFELPHAADAWSGVRPAQCFADIAPQTPHSSSGLYGREFFSDLSAIPPQNEDCLYLNVWTPKTEGPHPVALWIHGGGFCGGYSSEIEFDGEAFTRRGVVLVTAAYRLGLLGFLVHPEMKQVNLGLRDQLAALDWVRENIAAFGGDPENITLFGQSAGAMSAEMLTVSPFTAGKIRHVIFQSDLGFYADNGKKPVPRRRTRLNRLSSRFFKRQGLCFSELKAMPAAELVKLNDAYSDFLKARTGADFVLGPCVDGELIPCSRQRAVRTGRMPDIDYLAGCCLDDLKPYPADFDADSHRLLGGVRRFCSVMNGRVLREGRAYAYLFARKMPGSEHGAFHSAELWYVFGTLKRCWRPLEERDFALSEAMCDSWCRFMTEGNPGGKPCTEKMPDYLLFG